MLRSFPKGTLAMSFSFAEFVITKVQSDTPKPSGKPGPLMEVLSSDEYPGECFLLQVLGLMQITRHAGTKPKNRQFPSLHEMTEGGIVIRRLDPPHGLLVRHREKRQQKIDLSQYGLNWSETLALDCIASHFLCGPL
jgi:hypothetical protein